MPRLRNELDADRFAEIGEPTQFQTEINRYEANCGVCGGKYFVDEETLAGINRAAEYGTDNPFTCPECEQDFNDLLSEG
jgi:hypothetical protein